MDNLESLISGHKFLKGLSAGLLKKIVSCATVADFPAGKYIFKQGEKAANFYLLTKGRVAVGLDSADKATMHVETLNAGDVLGWSWLVAPYQWRFHALATGATYAVVINGEKLRGLCESDHELGYEIMKRFLDVIAARLEMANLQYLDLLNNSKGGLLK